MVSIDLTGANTISPESVVTDSSGVALFEISSLEVGTKTITASAGGVVLDDKPTIEFTTPVRTVSSSNSEVTIDKSSLYADGIEYVTITATIKDTDNAVYGGVNVEISATGSENIFDSTSKTTGDDGKVTFTLKSTAIETKTITITADGVILDSKPTVDFTEPPIIISSALSRVEVTPTTVYADGVQYATIVVTVIDTMNRAVDGANVLINVSGGSENILNQTSATTGSDGRASFTLKSTVVGERTITANANGVSLDGNAVVNFVSQGVSSVQSTVVAVPDSGIVANGSDYSRITITLKDVNGDTITGVVPNIEVSGSNNIISDIAPTNGDGVTYFDLRTTKAEAKNVKVSASDVLLQNNPIVIFKAGAASSITIDGSTNNQSVKVGEGLPSNLKVLVKDGYGNPVEGFEVEWNVTSFPDGGGDVVVTNNSISDVNGVASAEFTAGSVSGEYGVRASAIGVSGSPIDFSIVVTSGDAYSISKVSGDGQSVGVLSAAAQPLVVRVEDRYGNPVEGFRVDTMVDGYPENSSPPIINPQSPITDANGEAKTIVTIGNKIGNYKIKFITTPVLIGTPLYFNLDGVPGLPYRMEVVSGDNQTAMAGQNYPSPLVVRVTDSAGNGVSDVPITFSAINGEISAYTSGSDSSGKSAMVNREASSEFVDSTDSNGEVRVSLKAGTEAGKMGITISANTTLVKLLSASCVVTNGEISELRILSGDNQEVTVGEYCSQYLSVKATDIYGNVVSNALIQFSII
jgi:protocatechuate 3,4-dioxygenase beta subunit